MTYESLHYELLLLCHYAFLEIISHFKPKKHLSEKIAFSYWKHSCKDTCLGSIRLLAMLIFVWRRWTVYYTWGMASSENFHHLISSVFMEKHFKGTDRLINVFTSEIFFGILDILSSARQILIKKFLLLKDLYSKYSKMEGNIIFHF